MALSFELLSLGHATVAARYWRSKGRHFVTVVVKGSFALQQDSVMTVAAPSPICAEDRHLLDNPVASLVRASDLALHLAKPELVVVGSAFAPRGKQLKSTTARLTLQSEHASLIDKRLEVVGDRRAEPGKAPPEPTPFERLPLHYERAFGGITNRENPVGRGAVPDFDGRLSYPNIFFLEGKGVSPAGFGPIASTWPARSSLRGSLTARAANVDAEVEVPSDFNEHYFQTAALDQRVNGLAGGELITLTNMHPDLTTLRSFIPRVRGVGLVQSARGERLPVTLRIDTVHVEPDAMRAEIVYRGTLALAPEQLTRLIVAGVVETREQPFTFPDLSSMGGKKVNPVAMPSAESHASTMLLDSATPNGQSAASGTMLLDAEPSASRAPLPFSKEALLQAARARPVPPAPPPPSPSPPNGPTPGPSGTMMIADQSVSTTHTLPFAKGKRKRSGQVPAVITAKAATPWSEHGKIAPVKPASAGPLTSTVFVEVLGAEGGANAPSPPPTPDSPVSKPTAPAIEAAPSRDPSKSPWREEAPAPPPAPSMPAKQVAPQRTNVKGALYKLKR